MKATPKPALLVLFENYVVPIILITAWISMCVVESASDDGDEADEVHNQLFANEVLTSAVEFFGSLSEKALVEHIEMVKASLAPPQKGAPHQRFKAVVLEDEEVANSFFIPTEKNAVVKMGYVGRPLKERLRRTGFDRVDRRIPSLEVKTPQAFLTKKFSHWTLNALRRVTIADVLRGGKEENLTFANLDDALTLAVQEKGEVNIEVARGEIILLPEKLVALPSRRDPLQNVLYVPAITRCVKKKSYLNAVLVLTPGDLRAADRLPQDVYDSLVKDQESANELCDEHLAGPVEITLELILYPVGYTWTWQKQIEGKNIFIQEEKLFPLPRNVSVLSVTRTEAQMGVTLPLRTPISPMRGQQLQATQAA